MVITCDHRERSLIDHLMLADADVDVKPLDVGDFHISNADGFSLVVERKTLDDLSSSIIDGRYKEQKLRLDALRSQGTQVLFIVENTAKVTKKGLPHSTLLSAMLSTMLVGNFFVYRTKNTAETAHLLQILHKNIHENKYSDTARAVASTYNAVHTKKSDNYTPKLTYESMLRCVHGVSSNTAGRISTQFPTLESLVQGFLRLDEHQRPAMLCSIEKIGPKISARIYESIFG